MKTRYYTVVSYWPQTTGGVHRSERMSPMRAPWLYATKKEAVAQMREHEANGAVCRLGIVTIDYPPAPKRSDFA